MSERSITYIFTATREITKGCSHKFYIPGGGRPGLPSFSDLSITSATIEEIMMPIEFTTFTSFTNTSFGAAGGFTLVNPGGLTTLAEFVDSINSQLLSNGVGSATISPITITEDNGYKTTAYRLRVFYTDGFVVDHRLHGGAKFIGLEEVNLVGSGYYTFRTIFNNDDFNPNTVIDSRMTFTLSDGVDQWTSYYDIPSGTYSPVRLASLIQTAFQIGGQASLHVFNDLVVTYDSANNKFNFTVSDLVADYNTTTVITLGILKQIGVNSSLSFSFTQGEELAFQSPDAINLRFSEYLHIKSKNLTSSANNKKILYPGVKTLLTSIVVDKGYRNVLIKRPKEKIKYRNPLKLQYIDLEVVDGKNNPIDLNGAEWAITIKFTYNNTAAI
jgi:hypothetical protein